MKARPQITIAEPRIRMPAWRSASPKNLQDAAAEDLAHDPRQNLAMSPKVAIQSFGTASQVRAHYLITEISGWVASSVWVKT